MQVNIHYAKTNLSRLLELVERGEEVVIARAGKPVGRIVLCNQQGNGLAGGGGRAEPERTPHAAQPEQTELADPNTIMPRPIPLRAGLGQLDAHIPSASADPSPDGASTPQAFASPSPSLSPPPQAPATAAFRLGRRTRPAGQPRSL